TAAPELYTLSLHDALPICVQHPTAGTIRSSTGKRWPRSLALITSLTFFSARTWEREAKILLAMWMGVVLAAVAAGVAHVADLGRSEEHTSELQSRSDLVCR